MKRRQPFVQTSCSGYADGRDWHDVVCGLLQSLDHDHGGVLRLRPYLGRRGKGVRSELYLVNDFSKPGKFVLWDDAGRELLSNPLPVASRFKIGIDGESFVIRAKSGKILLRVPISATPKTTLRSDTQDVDISAKWFTVILHAQTGSRDKAFKMTIHWDE